MHYTYTTYVVLGYISKQSNYPIAYCLVTFIVNKFVNIWKYFPHIFLEQSIQNVVLIDLNTV